MLAIVVPPTGADFNFRAYQLPMAVVAALIMLLLVLAVQRHQLVGQHGADVDALPGRTPAARAAAAAAGRGAADPRLDFRR